MELRETEWAALLDDEKHGGWLVPTKDWAQRSVSMWIRKEIQAVLWKNYTPLKLLQSHGNLYAYYSIGR